MSGDLNKEINRVRNLKQNQDENKPSDAVIEAQAKMNIWKRQIAIKTRFSSITDKDNADKIFNDYLDNYDFDTYSDMCALADLVFEEVLKRNIQDLLSKASADESNSYISDKQIKSLHDVETRVLDLQKRLNIIKDETQDNDLTALEQYEKRMDRYITYNRNEFEFVCPDCGQPTLIRRRCDNKNFETIKHPFFSGRFYYNARGMALVKAKIWTKEQYAYAFFTHTDYVTWCIKNENKIPDVPNFSKEEIQEFCNKNPYLKKAKIPENIKNQEK